MAAKRKSARSTPRASGLAFAVLAGLLIGLTVAAAVAFYVTRAPVPFVDRATREPAQGADLRGTDPNQGLAGDGAAEPGNKPMDDLGALIATLPKFDGKPGDAPLAAPSVPVPQAPPPGKPRAEPPAASSGATGNYYLQAGAFRVLEDAESLRARILLLGLPVSVQRAEVNGMPVNRVRIGPFARLDDMNRARARLGENKIETAIVRQ
jgi:cell division protein FtsN